MANFWKIIKESRGNAIWDFIKWTWNHGGRLVVLLSIALSVGAGWIRNMPLPLLVLFVVACTMLSFFAIKAWQYYAMRKINKALAASGAGYAEKALLRMSFTGTRKRPQPVDTHLTVNVYRWYTLALENFALIPSAPQIPQIQGTTYVVFLTFERPIEIREMNLFYDAYFSPNPVVELEDICESSAVVMIKSEQPFIPAGILELRFEKYKKQGT